MPSIGLFNSELDASNYRDLCNTEEGLPKPGSPPAEFPYGWTLTWSGVVEQEGKWPIQIHPLVPVPEGVEVVTTPDS